MENVVIIENYLTSSDMELLLSDLLAHELIFRRKMGDVDLGNYGSALDPFEFHDIPPHSAIRREPI